MARVPGCRCSQCYSLREYMLDLTGKDFGLAPAPGHPSEMRLRVMTLDPDSEGESFDGPIVFEPACDGSYTCECPKCRAEVARRLRKRKPHRERLAA